MDQVRFDLSHPYIDRAAKSVRLTKMSLISRSHFEVGKSH